MMNGCLTGSVLVAATLLGFVHSQGGDEERHLETYTFKVQKNKTTSSDQAQFDTYSTVREITGTSTIASDYIDNTNDTLQEDDNVENENGTLIDTPEVVTEPENAPEKRIYCRDIPLDKLYQSSSIECYPRVYSDCYLFTYERFFPFLKNFKRLEHHFYNNQHEMRYVPDFYSKRTYCTEWFEADQRRQKGLPEPKVEQYWPKSLEDCRERDLILRMDFSQEHELMAHFDEADGKNRAYVCVEYVKRRQEKEYEEAERINRINHVHRQLDESNSTFSVIIFLALFMVVVSSLAYCLLRVQSYSPVNESEGRNTSNQINQRTTTQQQGIQRETPRPSTRVIVAQSRTNTEPNQRLPMTRVLPPPDCAVEYINEERSRSERGLDPPPAYVSRCPSTCPEDPPTYEEALNEIQSKEKDRSGA